MAKQSKKKRAEIVEHAGGDISYFLASVFVVGCWILAAMVVIKAIKWVFL